MMRLLLSVLRTVGMVLLSLVACIAFGFLIGTFKFNVVPVSMAILFVTFYFAVQREEKSKKVVSDDSE